MNSCIITVLFVLIFPFSAHSNDFSKSDIYWLTSNIYYESRGEDLYGQLMVGLVTLERLKNGRWGDTIKKVVTSPKQFSWYNPDKLSIPNNIKEWNTSKVVAFFSIMIYNNIIDHGIMYYHNNTVTPYWLKDMIKIIQIGNHTFYIEK